MEDLLGLISAPFVLLVILFQLASDPRRPLWVRLCVIGTAGSLGALMVGAFGMMFLDERPWTQVFLFGFAGVFLALFTVLCSKAMGWSTEATPLQKKSPDQLRATRGH